MNTVVNIALVGLGGYLLYKYFKKREAEMQARLNSVAKEVKTEAEKVLEYVYEDPNADNWKSAAYAG